jgi:hypothetical protein
MRMIAFGGGYGTLMQATFISLSENARQHQGRGQSKKSGETTADFVNPLALIATKYIIALSYSEGNKQHLTVEELPSDMSNAPQRIDMLI